MTSMFPGQEQPTGSVGWFGDPSGRYAQRYWDGNNWTSRVRTATGEAWDEPGERFSEGPRWLRNRPGCFYRSPAERHRLLARPNSYARIREQRLHASISLVLVAAWITFTLIVLNLQPIAVLIAPVAGLTANYRTWTKQRFKQLLGFAPPDDEPDRSSDAFRCH